MRLTAIVAASAYALAPVRSTLSRRGLTGLRAVAFDAPLVADGYAARSEGDALLLYLPGFDGSTLAPFLQWPALGDAGFDVRCASMDASDRSTFEVLAAAAAAYAAEAAAGRPVVLVGESFGGTLAVAVADRLGDACDGLVLVNPATSFSRSALAARAPPLLDLPEALYPLGLAALLPLFVDPSASVKSAAFSQFAKCGAGSNR